MLTRLKKFIPKKLLKIIQPIYHYLWAWSASLFYGFPSKKLIVIGVTGTAGKTSTVYLIAKMLEKSGYRTGFTSTTIFSDGQQEWLNDKKMTMPGRFFIQKLLRRMVRNGCLYVVVETTSEGIKQFRHHFINYDTLVFTGLYPEHIESHGSFEKYREAKGKLFAHLKNCSTKYLNELKTVCRPSSELQKLDFNRVHKTIIVNGDDENAGYFLNYPADIKIVYSLNSETSIDSWAKVLSSEALIKDFTIIIGRDVETSGEGTNMTINEQTINLKLLGEFNALNALAAYAVGINQGLKIDNIKDGLESISSLVGKLEVIKAGQDFLAIVDYSFEPQALDKLYQTLKLIPHNRIIHVLGSTGGGRDRARRPILGRLAGSRADIIIVTNEDPYDEDPTAIIEQVAAGAEEMGKVLGQNLFKILDRREAIKKALDLAKNDDLTLFTGKGAEQYICQADGRKIPWDEREEVRKGIVDKLCIDKK